jgi:hypothetical protein
MRTTLNIDDQLLSEARRRLAKVSVTTSWRDDTPRSATWYHAILRRARLKKFVMTDAASGRK